MHNKIKLICGTSFSVHAPSEESDPAQRQIVAAASHTSDLLEGLGATGSGPGPEPDAVS